jgi:hypothetical protein
LIGRTAAYAIAFGTRLIVLDLRLRKSINLSGNQHPSEQS